MDRAGHDPGNGVGDVQVLRRAVHLEDGKDPHDPQAAGTDERDDHRPNGVAQAPQAAHHGIHDAAQSIGPGQIAQADDPLPDHFLLTGGVNAHQRMAKVIDQVAKHQSGHDHKALTIQQSPVHPAALPSPVVLASKGQVCLVEGVHGLIDKVLDVAGRSGTGHHSGAKGVDGGLDQHIGQGEHNALEAGGQADLQDLTQNMPVHLHRLQVQAQGAVLLGQAEDDQPGGHILGDGGGQGDPRHVHLQ